MNFFLITVYLNFDKIVRIRDRNRIRNADLWILRSQIRNTAQKA